MLTLQNFPTEFKRHDYDMYVRKLIDSDPTYIECRDEIKKITDTLMPLTSKETLEALLNNGPIGVKACQSAIDVLNELERRYRTLEAATGKGGKRVRPAGEEGPRPEPLR